LPEFSATGGARVGVINASWPLATLTVSAAKLVIRVRFLGCFSFTPDQISSIERVGRAPVMGWGIQIHHTVADYPERLVFWTLGNPNTLLDRIHRIAFIPTGRAEERSPRQRGFAIRWSAVVVTAVLWNVLFYADLGPQARGQPGPFILVALALLFGTSLATLHVPAIQRILLKPGRSVTEVAPLIRLLVFVSGFILLIVSFLLLTGAFEPRRG
jgi:hypothetical protein